MRPATREPDVDPDRFAAVFLVGGHGTMWDFPGNEALARVVGAVASHGVVSAVCQCRRLPSRRR